MPQALVWWIDEFTKINYWKEGENFDSVELSGILHLFNLKDISDEELEKRVSNLLWKDHDIHSPETLTYVTSLYQKALTTYKNTFLIDIKEPFVSQKFHSGSDIIRFLKLTATSWHKERRQIYCDLVKMTFCHHEVERHPQMKYAEENTKQFIANNYLKSCVPEIGNFDFDLSKIMEKKEWKDYYETRGTYSKVLPNGQRKKINCTLRYRWKSADKMLVKMLWNKTWSAKIMNIIKDSIGIELEADNKEESFHLLEYQYYVHKKHGNIEQTEFRQKLWFYTQEDIKDFCDKQEASNEFREYISTKLSALKKSNGTAKYQDCKLQWMIDLGDGMLNGCESRVVIKWNKNQSGLSASEIVDGKKVIEAMIGLRWWVSKSYIKSVIKNIWELPNIYKNNNSIESEFLKNLIKVPVPKLNRNIFSTTSRLEEVITNASTYPDFIVSAIKKSFFPKLCLEEVVNHVRAKAQEI